MTKAIITTSAFPFHYGHKSLYDEAIKIFGENNVKVIIATNSEKKVDFEKIKYHLVPYNIKFEIISNRCIADYCKEEKIPFIVRGIRNAVDAEYELKLSFLNKEINSDIQTIFIPTNEIYSKISSSTIRELLKYNKIDLATKYMNKEALFRFLERNSYVCHFGKSCSGKSKYLTHLDLAIIDFDKYLWEILKKVKGAKECSQIKKKSKELFLKKDFKTIHDNAKKIMDESFWASFFDFDNFPIRCGYPVNFDWASVGFYFDLLPLKQRARMKFVKIETTEEKRKLFIKSKGFENKIEALDEMYVDPPYYDKKIII